MPYQKKTFDPSSNTLFKISRSKIDLFLECARCFYLSERLGVGRPQTPPFTLNSAVDHLLKKEFDVHRKDKTAHPLMEKYGLRLVPFQHEMMDTWRANFTGVRFEDRKNGFLIFGAVDDIWQDQKTGKIYVVDYKATAKDKEVKELEDTRWHNQYRRQMEVYQWLLRKNGFDVSDTGYFVYVNGKRDNEAFDGKLEFDINLIPYKGSDEWVEGVLPRIKECLVSEEIPLNNEVCEYCAYREKAGKAFKETFLKNREDRKAGRAEKIRESKKTTLF